jgi:hypothetical protein
MEFIAELFEMDRDHAAAQTNELFTKFALHEHTRQRIENLSHGTRQRLAIASALLHDPKVFVIDEPMVGLDPIHARTVKREIKERSLSGHHRAHEHAPAEHRRRTRRPHRHHPSRQTHRPRHPGRTAPQHEQRGTRLEDIFLSMVEEELAHRRSDEIIQQLV